MRSHGVDGVSSRGVAGASRTRPVSARTFWALLALLAAVNVAVRFLAPNPCDPPLELSPYSGVCSAEGSDSWYGAVQGGGR